jgi:dipeptidyl aminopeptidase/acylaminoacyl peptidase
VIHLSNVQAQTQVYVWDTTTGKLLANRPYHVDVHRRDYPNGSYSMWLEAPVAFTPDGEAVTVKRDKRLAIEETTTGRTMALLPEKLGRSVTFSPDGQLVAAGILKPKDDPFEQPTMEGLCLIESATGQEVVSIRMGQGRLVDFSRDGRLLATVDQKAIHIWDVATGDESFRWPWPEGVRSNPDWSPAHSLAFLPDGRGVVTGMDDGTLLVWDVLARRRPIRPGKHETLETLWSALADEARKAHGAVYTLAATPAATVPFLAERLKAAADIDDKLLVKLLADLDSDRFAVREAAQHELTQRRDNIEPALRRFLESKSTLEARRRIETILASPRPVPCAATLRALRAIRVLEAIGTPEARQLLRNLAGGAAAARQTREAKAALQRLTPQSSASR